LVDRLKYCSVLLLDVPELKVEGLPTKRQLSKSIYGWHFPE